MRPCRKRTPGGISTAYPCGKSSSRGIGIVGKDQSYLSVMTVAHDDSGRFLLIERRDRIEGTKPVEICNLTSKGKQSEGEGNSDRAEDKAELEERWRMCLMEEWYREVV